MIPSKKSRTVLLIVTAWAIAGNYGSHQMTQSPFPVCSAWTVDPGVHRHHRWHPTKNHLKRRRHESLLCREAVPTKAPSDATNAATIESNATYRDLFPSSDSVTNGTLQTDSVHKLYYEIHGTGPLLALFLHGGPGAGCFPNHARFFDPTKYTVVLLDQRGAGRSTPKGCVENNTLHDLVEDCERLRLHLQPRNASDNTKPWDVVLGGSWGATLGLAYAQRHPAALRSVILRGICALRPSEVDWLFSASGGSSAKLPEAWKNFSDAVGTFSGDNNSNPNGRETLHAYYDCLFNEAGANGTADNALRLAAARSWMMWEMGVTSTAGASNRSNASSLTPGPVLVSSPDSGSWRFENHLGQAVVDAQGRSPETVVSELRRDIQNNNGLELSPPATGPRPVNLVDESIPLVASIRQTASNGMFNSRKNKNNNNKTSAGRFQLPPDYVPAQAMLTCFYSVNDRFVMGNDNLVERSISASSATPVKIIGIQGGRDPICPPDTALDLLQSLQASNNSMELRIPLESGHSMYDPAIKHELVTATDRLADELLRQ